MKTTSTVRRPRRLAAIVRRLRSRRRRFDQLRLSRRGAEARGGKRLTERERTAAISAARAVRPWRLP
jgi:hypothetical protein